MLHMRSNESFTNIFDNSYSQELFGIGKKKPKKEPYRPDEKTLTTMRKRAVNILKEVFSKFGNPKGFAIFTKEDVDDWKENSSDGDDPPLGRYDVDEFTNGKSRDEKEYKKFNELFEKIVDVIDIACKSEPFDIGSDGGDWDGGFFYLVIKEPESKESYDMSTEDMHIQFMAIYNDNYVNVEYRNIFKKKIQKNGKYNKDLPLKVYNFMTHNIGFKGGFPRLKRHFKILSGKDHAYSPAGIEYLTDKNDYWDDPEKPPVAYNFTVYTLSPPFKKDDKVKFNKFQARLAERNEIAKKKIKEVYPSAKMQTTITPLGVENDEDDKFDCFVQNFHVKVPLSFFDIDQEKGGESLINEEIEQNNVLSLENALFSMEDDDDASSFEDAAEESSGENDFGGDDTGGGDGWGDDSGGDDSGGDDGGWGDDSGGDDGWGDDTGDGGDGSGDGDGESSGIDVIDNNKGSSLNPFTQINHKIYTLDTLNALSNSIKNSLDLYNDRYADWSEVIQLNDLSEIVDEEKRSFMMQQNPENDIKLGLYLEQYKTIVQNISHRIEVLKSNNKA